MNTINDNNYRVNPPVAIPLLIIPVASIALPTADN